MITPKKKPEQFAPKSGPTPKEMSEIATGARMANILPDIRREIEDSMNQTRTRVFTQIRDGSFTPELAEAAWREVHAAHMLLKKFETRVSLGIDAATRHTTSFKIGED